MKLMDQYSVSCLPTGPRLLTDDDTFNVIMSNYR